MLYCLHNCLTFGLKKNLLSLRKMFWTGRYIILDVLLIGIAISNWIINLNVTAQLGLSLLQSHVPLLRQDLRYSNIDLSFLL
jgi:hypothetical protein